MPLPRARWPALTIDLPGRPARSTSTGAVVAALTVATSGILPIHLTGALATQLRADLGLTASTLGVATTAFFGASVLTSIGVSQRLDRAGWQRSMLVAAVGQVLALGGIGMFATSVPMLSALLALGGFAHAVGMPAGNLAIVTHVPPRRQAAIFGIRQSAIPAAALLAGLAVPSIGLTVGWRWAFILGLGGPVMTAALVLRATGPLPARAGTRTLQPSDRKNILSPGLVAMIGATILGASVVNVSSAFFVSSAVALGTSAATAGTLLAVGSVTAIVARVVIGIHVDRRGTRGFGAMAMMLVLGAVGWILLASGAYPALLIGTPLTFGAGTGWAGLMHYILVSQHPDNPAAASAAVLAFGYAGGAVAPLAFGIGADHVGYQAAWMATVLAALVAAGLTLTAGRLFEARATLAPPAPAESTTATERPH